MTKKHLFDYHRLALHKKKASYGDNAISCIEYLSQEAFDSARLVDQNVESILLLGNDTEVLKRLLNVYYSAPITLGNNNLEQFANFQFDLIISFMQLHWINDVQGFLGQIRNLLKSTGVCCVYFPAGGSLAHLRKRLTAAELSSNIPHSPRIIPLINFDQTVPLLQQAGFVDIVVDQEKIAFEYHNVLSFMREISRVGESNALNNMPNYAMPKKMFNLLKEDTSPFIDHINLVSCVLGKNKGVIKLQLDSQSN